MLTRYRFYLSAVFFVICSISQVHAGNCDKFFKNSGAVQGTPECELTCASGSVGMGTYNCPRKCKQWCGSGLEAYDESKEGEKISDKEADQALDNAIKDLCALANNHVAQPSIGNAIDSVTKVPGSATLLFNADNLSRMAKARNNQQRASAGLDLYSGVSGLAGVSVWEQAVSDFKRFMGAMKKGPSGLQQLGREMVREQNAGKRDSKPRRNLPATCQ